MTSFNEYADGSRRLFTAVAVVSALCAAGCASEEASAADSTETSGSSAATETEPAVLAQVGSGTWTVSAPNGVTAQITADGPGCPSGTWRPTLSADGSRISVSFDQL